MGEKTRSGPHGGNAPWEFAQVCLSICFVHKHRCDYLLKKAKGEEKSEQRDAGSSPKNSPSISFPEILKRQNRNPLRSLYYLT